jgi:hypothetical protein
MIRHYTFFTCDAYQTLDFAISTLTWVSIKGATMDAKGQRETAKMAAEKILHQGNRLGWAGNFLIASELRNSSGI